MTQREKSLKSFFIWLWNSGTLINTINSKEGNSSLFTVDFIRYNKSMEYS